MQMPLTLVGMSALWVSLLPEILRLPESVRNDPKA